MPLQQLSCDLLVMYHPCHLFIEWELHAIISIVPLSLLCVMLYISGSCNWVIFTIIHAWTQTHTRPYTHICIHSVYTHACTYTSTHTTHTHARMHTHTHTHTHIYLQHIYPHVWENTHKIVTIATNILLVVFCYCTSPPQWYPSHH